MDTKYLKCSNTFLAGCTLKYGIWCKLFNVERLIPRLRTKAIRKIHETFQDFKNCFILLLFIIKRSNKFFCVGIQIIQITHYPLKAGKCVLIYARCKICFIIIISTLLKKRNKSSSTWVKYNSFPLIKRAFSSWVDFTRLNDLK